MDTKIVNSSGGVTLIAGGPLQARDLASSRRRAPILVAADGGADAVLRHGLLPDAVIGDFDSLSVKARAVIPAERLHHLPEQETTDFDKALRSVSAPFVIGLGCLGGRMDHSLAALNALVRQSAPCFLLGGPDVVFAAPAQRWITLSMAVGARLSLFPLARVTGQSRGLAWPIDGLTLAPDAMIGTSNRVTQRVVSLWFDQPGMIAILPRRYLDSAVGAVVRGPACVAP